MRRNRGDERGKQETRVLALVGCLAFLSLGGFIGGGALF
jgi:hypothetical protein